MEIYRGAERYEGGREGEKEPEETQKKGAVATAAAPQLQSGAGSSQPLGGAGSVISG